MTTNQNFTGMTVAAFETRMASEMTRLIERYGGCPSVVPALREIPILDNPAVVRFGAKLIEGQVDILILMTGIGTATLFEILRSRFSLPSIMAGLAHTAIVARGPKPVAALKAVGMTPTIAVDEPNTWVEVVSALDEYRSLQGLCVALQEYGASNPDLLEALTQRGAEVVPVPIYRWGLPEDTGPLKQVLNEIIEGKVQVMVITNAAQVDHLMELLKREDATARFKLACKKMVIASIGPTASERLRHYDLPVDFEPSHPKMGVLVKETAERVYSLRQAKIPRQS